MICDISEKQQKLATRTTKLELISVPSTAGATTFHSFRVYAQILQWKEEEINVQHWGWKVTGEQVNPVMTDIPPAPDNLLRIIRGSTTGYSTLRCSYWKHNLECSPACSHCKGSGCYNSPVQKILDGISIDNYGFFQHVFQFWTALD